MSDSVQPYGLKYASLPCQASTARAYSNSTLLSQWYYPTISSYVIPFSSCIPSFPASGFYQMSHYFTSGGQSIGVSAWPSVLPMNTEVISFRMDWVGSPCSPKDSQESSPTPQIKNIIFLGSGFFTVQLSHPYMTTGKTIALTRWTWVGKVMSLLLNISIYRYI